MLGISMLEFVRMYDRRKAGSAKYGYGLRT